ncbi:hypothetical protein ACFGVR_15485 [Mucilaginibacter sp. AW1-3]
MIDQKMKKLFLAITMAVAAYSQSSAQNVLNPTGYVGIGTGGPAFPLDVSGITRLLTTTDNVNLLQLHNLVNNGVGVPTTQAILMGMFNVPNYSSRIVQQSHPADHYGSNLIFQTHDYGPSTSYVDALTLREDGSAVFSNKIGIGLITPSAKLHLQEDGGYGATALKLTNRNNTQTFGVAIDVNAVDDGRFMIYNVNNNTPNFVIDNAGNVGVGTESPLSLFQVEDGVSKASIGKAGGSQALNWGTSYLGFNASRVGSAPNFSWLTNGDNNNNGGGVIYSSVFGDMYFATVPTTGATGQTLFDADIAGHIALKISHTDGAVYAKQVYVQTSGFPDYVFKKDYKLMPLAQVKSYIDQNHHLPDMPAAAVVEKDGINLGEMNKLLTKKLEELTLYLLQKDEQLKTQEARLRKVEARLKQKGR